MTRRLLAAALGAAVAMGAGAASAADRASLLLNWYLGGLHAPFYLGVERGFYTDEGIELTINEGRGSARSVQVVAAEGDTFGMADAGSLMLGAAKEAPVKTVMSLLNTSGFGVISLKEKGIATAKDLEGKRLAVSAGDALTQLFPAVMAANDLDPAKIEQVFVDPPAKVVTVLEGRADALLGGIDDQYFLIEQQGKEPAALRFADLGANTVGITIIAHEKTIADNPDLVRRFVKASVRSWEAAREDPAAAVDAALKVKPDLNRESTLKQLEVDLGLLESPATKGKGIGFGAPEDWEHTKELLVRYRDLETDRDATSFFTNEFLPQ
ncbi:MAG TPA: ABC transporter substrate-binding protein [Geminicoccaceae bacterium]|nr:ABC transporter substrate-binding protein [Geminicoccaceae bacterium]